MILFLILFGVLIWYFWFGLESFINGAFGGWKLPFSIFWSDLKDGFKLLGWKHAIFTHLFIPSAPLIIYFVGKIWNYE